MFESGRQLDWAMDPLEALRRWPAERRVALLHSGRYHQRWARRSILAEPVGTFRFSGTPETGGRTQWLGDAPCPVKEPFAGRPFQDLRALLEADDGLWIGYLGYDLGRWIETLPARAKIDRHWPIIDLAWCPGYLVHDTAAGCWTAHGTWAAQGVPPLQPQIAGFVASDLRSVFDQPRYEAMVARALEYIAAGDIFQVNLAQRFTVDLGGPWPLAQRALFARLAQISPAWYGAYLELAADDRGAQHAIASTSPELFLEIDAGGGVLTRPIKGTRPASVDAAELRDSVKDTAELNMIVDLLRNDLGRVCDYGSVQVVQPRTIESHPTIHHGVATVAGKLHERKDVVDLLRATMPGGSITGAPKVRAMQIIDELEPVRRGPYCGCIGYLSRQGSCLNVAIRTMQIETLPGRDETARVDFSVGGGIVADSQPAAEYQETLDKAAAILEALGLR